MLAHDDYIPHHWHDDLELYWGLCAMAPDLSRMVLSAIPPVPSWGSQADRDVLAAAVPQQLHDVSPIKIVVCSTAARMRHSK